MQVVFVFSLRTCHIFTLVAVSSTAQLALAVLYRTRAKARAISKVYASSWQAFVWSPLAAYYMCEVVLLLLQPYPFIDEFALSGFGHKALIGIFVRLPVLGLRVLHDWSPLFRRRADILRRAHSRNLKGHDSFWSVLKASFNLFSLPLLVFLLLYIVTAGAYSVHMFERQYLTPNSQAVGTFADAKAVWAPAVAFGVDALAPARLVRYDGNCTQFCTCVSHLSRFFHSFHWSFTR